MPTSAVVPDPIRTATGPEPLERATRWGLAAGLTLVAVAVPVPVVSGGSVYATSGSFRTRHTGIWVAGQMTVRMDDGTETTIGPGDVTVIEPGHDAWVVGDEPCVMYDTGIAAYAKPE